MNDAQIEKPRSEPPSRVAKLVEQRMNALTGGLSTLLSEKDKCDAAIKLRLSDVDENEGQFLLRLQQQKLIGRLQHICYHVIFHLGYPGCWVSFYGVSSALEWLVKDIIEHYGSILKVLNGADHDKSQKQHRLRTLRGSLGRLAKRQDLISAIELAIHQRGEGLQMLQHHTAASAYYGYGAIEREILAAETVISRTMSLIRDRSHTYNAMLGLLLSDSREKDGLPTYLARSDQLGYQPIFAFEPRAVNGAAAEKMCITLPLVDAQSGLWRLWLVLHEVMHGINWHARQRSRQLLEDYPPYALQIGEIDQAIDIEEKLHSLGELYSDVGVLAIACGFDLDIFVRICVDEVNRRARYQFDHVARDHLRRIMMLRMAMVALSCDAWVRRCGAQVGKISFARRVVLNVNGKARDRPASCGAGLRSHSQTAWEFLERLRGHSDPPTSMLQSPP